MNSPPPPPPPPPPHGSTPNTEGKKGGLPDGNYDIFIIPPHSAGSGFLYLPSLQPHRNSFLAGVGCTLAAVAIWTVIFPVIRQWVSTMIASGGMGVVVMMLGMGVAGWAWGKTQLENGWPSNGQSGGSSYQNSQTGSASNPQPQSNASPGYESANGGPTPKPFGFRAGPTGAQTPNGSQAPKSAWEKAREETKKKEDDRKKAEEIRQRVEELRKKREADEKERQRQRERETRERESRERREKEAKERAERASAEARASPTKARQPTARTEADEDAYSYRPYDPPKAKTASSVYSGSYAPSQSTARSTPPPSHRGPYSTKDPDKIMLKAVYSFTNAHQKKAISQLISGVGAVTDGLILRITTEGLFIDDDVRSVPQREWDVKAWTMKLVEVRTEFDLGKSYSLIC